jgi:CO/xanthine dehydrogenase FAD-binding subunit
MSLVNATSLSQVLELLAGGARPVAGGSDLVVGARQGKAPLPMRLVAIDRVAELREILVNDDGVRLGPLVNHATIETHPHLVAHYTALADGSALVGSPATRNVGTIGGNVMNGSPAMDTGSPLSVFGRGRAGVGARHATGHRRRAVDGCRHDMRADRRAVHRCRSAAQGAAVGQRLHAPRVPPGDGDRRGRRCRIGHPHR